MLKLIKENLRLIGFADTYKNVNINNIMPMS